MDNKFQIYLAMAKLAHPIIKHYAADFYLHDANVLAQMQSGDVALWAPREMGSSLIIVARNGISNDRAEDSFKAAKAVFGELPWQVIATDIRGNFTLEPEESPSALITQYKEATASMRHEHGHQGIGSVLVSELHL